MSDKKNVINEEELEKVNGGVTFTNPYSGINNNALFNTTITNPDKIGIQLPGTNIQPSFTNNIVVDKK